MAFLKFENTCSLRIIESFIHSIDVCFREHIHTDYLVSSVFHLAVHLLKILNYLHYLGISAIRLSVNPVRAVAATSKNMFKHRNTIFDPRFHNVAIAQSFGENWHVFQHEGIVFFRLRPDPLCLTARWIV